MAQKIIKGDDLMLFDSTGKSIAYATSHVLTITANTADVSTKDHGVWQGSEVNKISWEISSENLYTDNSYDALFTAMINRTPVKVYFGHKIQTDVEKTVVNDDYPFWTGGWAKDAVATDVPATAATNTGYTGLVFISSLTANANTGENATFSLTLTGNGKISKETMIAVASVKSTDDPTPDLH